jgi:carboxyl-terminal processing protease
MRVACSLILIAGLAYANEDLEPLVKRLTDAFALIEENAADPVNPEQVFFQGAIPGALRKLDPHSVFFDPQQFEQLKQLQTSTQKGFGSVVSVLPGRVIVLQTLPGTPSAKSGMAAGDEILAINGYRLDRLEIEQLIGLLTESRQRQARLDVRRPGNARIMQFVLTPEAMQSPSVERAFYVAAGIGYLRVASFDQNTGKEIREAIDKLGGAKLAGLVLDLRGNPGGLLPAALETASLFLPPGAVLLTVRGRAVAQHEEKVPAENKPYTFPVAVLINNRSASASEIVAGALQDHDRAHILGEPSFGKGLVESVYPLSQGAGIALTTALYYTPSGRSIQRPLDSTQFAISVKQQDDSYQTAGGRKVTGGGGIIPDLIVRPAPLTRLRAVLDASGSFTNFATEYTQKHRVEEGFEVTPALLDEFQLFLSQRNIRPRIAEWSSERGFIVNRLKAEIFNQSLGVEKGDEVEAERDPAIQRALEMLSRPVQ